MFILSCPLHRNGEACREYYQPESKGLIPGAVFEEHEAKQYPTAEAAQADIPNWVALHQEDLKAVGWNGDLVEAETRFRESIQVQQST